MGEIIQFETGATRDSDAGKLDYEGFLSPLVLERYAQYLDKHRLQSDGNYRDSDNWQKGIPPNTYIKSAWRHLMEWWKGHRMVEPSTDEQFEDSMCALMFNVMGYLHECLKGKNAIKWLGDVPISQAGCRIDHCYLEFSSPDYTPGGNKI